MTTLSYVRARLPLVRPHVAAHGTVRERDVLLVRASLDGAEGWGECSALPEPTYTHEWVDGAELVLPLLFRGVPVRDHPMATCALRTAVDDLRARLDGGPLLPPGRPAVASCAVVGVEPGALDGLVREVGEALGAGHRSVKVKVRPGWDVEPLHALRSTWPDLDLAADANGSYGDAPSAVAALDRFGLRYLEQPLGPDDLVGSARLAARVGTPIALDEAVTSPGLAAAAAALGSCTIFNVKPARVGGAGEALAVRDVAAEHGITCFVGGMLETGVGRALALHVAAQPGFDLPADLGPSSRYYVDDLTGPFELQADGTLPVPTGPGLGVTPRLP